MEEDKLNKIFRDFNPKLTSDDSFMDRLKINLDSVEIVKVKNAEIQAIRRRALLLSALAGFVAGFLCCLYLPVLAGMIEDLLNGFSYWVESIAQYAIGVSIFVVAGVVALVSLSVYDISLALIRYPSKLNT